MKPQSRIDTQQESSFSFNIEVEVVPGLEALAAQEISVLFRKDVRMSPENEQRAGSVRLRYRGDLARLEDLRVAQAVYVVEPFDIPRPKALLGNTEFRVVMKTINKIRDTTSFSDYKTVHISAAGSNSSVMTRFANEVAVKTNLQLNNEAGDLWIRLRRGANGNGWELLVRLGNRPLATRPWRICNFEGALNATVAHAMVLLSEPKVTDRVLNLASGSATIMIERDLWGGAQSITGFEQDIYTIMCARQNTHAARVDRQVVQSDIKKLPLNDAVANVLFADLPFGHLSGSHKENLVLYPALLAEAARVSSSEAVFVVLTHEIKLMQTCLALSRQWRLQKEVRINLRGLHPRIYVLTKRG